MKSYDAKEDILKSHLQHIADYASELCTLNGRLSPLLSSETAATQMLHGTLPRDTGLPCRTDLAADSWQIVVDGQSFRNLGEQSERSELTLVETFPKIVE